MPTRAGRVLALACALLASACTAPGERVGAPTAEHFALTGSISVKVAEKGYPGRIRWQHRGVSDEIWIYTPVGSAVAHLYRDAAGALLVDARGKEYRSGDLRELSRSVLGWELPLDALQYWVRGEPWPEGGAAEGDQDSLGRRHRLDQGEWRVVYLDWAGEPGSWLPARLEVVGRDLKVRLAIGQWRFDDPVP